MCDTTLLITDLLDTTSSLEQRMRNKSEVLP